MPVQPHLHLGRRPRLTLTGRYVDSINGWFRDRHLNGQLFDSVLEAKALLEAFCIEFHKNRAQSPAASKPGRGVKE